MVLGSSFSYFCLSLYPECVLWSSFALPFLSSRCLPSSSALSSASSSAVPWVTTDWQCVHWWVIPVVLDRAHEATSTLTSRIATVYKCCGYLQARSWLLLLLFLPQIWSGNLVLSTCSQHHNPHTYTPTHTHTQKHNHTHTKTHFHTQTNALNHTPTNTLHQSPGRRQEHLSPVLWQIWEGEVSHNASGVQKNPPWLTCVSDQRRGFSLLILLLGSQCDSRSLHLADFFFINQPEIV